MRLHRWVLGYAAAACLARGAPAATPIGWLDAAGDGIFGGWARDDDFAGPIQVKLYVDGALFHVSSASLYQPDVGTCAFMFLHPAFGPGSHEARAYAVGVDAAGQPDGDRRELDGSPSHWSEPPDREYWLTSRDGQVRVAFDRKFGGAITKIYDDARMPGRCLVDWEQAGAMFQPAFWLLPRHDQLPPACINTPDMWYDNPTLAGFVGDGSKGNPIGIMGTDADTPDPAEFIQYENNGQTVHFKSRFIRYDYCLGGIGAPMSQIQRWNTGFYLEQWAEFLRAAGRTLRLRSRITCVADPSRSMTTRQLPILFAFHLPRVAYWRNGQKVVEHCPSEVGIDPDANWAALIAGTDEVGIGMVLAAGTQAMLGRSRFGTGQIGTGQDGEPLSVLYPAGGVPDLRTFGTLEGVELDPAYPDHAFLFHPGGSFEWTIHCPIGDLGTIQTSAERILRHTVPADFDYDQDVDQADFGYLQTCLTGPHVALGNPDCRDADLNGDSHVDEHDLSILLRCASGAGSPADSDCAD